VQRLLEQPAMIALAGRFGAAELTAAARAAVDTARMALLADPDAEPPAEESLAQEAAARLLAGAEPGLRPVINATGVILHTNLGRAPLPTAALAAMAEVGAGYSNLEFDLERGRRGARTQGVEPLLCEITGAEAGLAVNNAAAAVLLALSALAGREGGEVIVSRGELVEIGGGFRIPDVIAQGGARLVEVGTTNRTRLADYAAAITSHTRVILKVHQSNYRMLGFTGEASLAELAGLSRARGLVLMHDLGGGALLDLSRFGLPREATAQDSLQAGADLVAFSGDKLMGGPQAGLLAGRRAVLEPLRRHPLLRAVRLDKTTLAALEATLRLYRDPAQATAAVPALAMLAQEPEALALRAERVRTALAGRIGAEGVASEAFTGGGTLPAQGVRSWALALQPPGGAEAFAARLRHGRPPVVARIAEGRVLLDMMTVRDGDVALLAAAVLEALEA
jgi:L-seryl-tRNA(Ser) seleniumtransferase